MKKGYFEETAEDGTKVVIMNVPITPKTEPEEGRKDDTSKIDWYPLMQQFAPELEEVCKVLHYGAEKYGSFDNWRRVPNLRQRYFSAAMRHMIAREREDYTDAESGLSHTAHAICCLLFSEADRRGRCEN